MKVLGRKVVIKPDEKEEVSSSGIVVVNVHTDHHAKGTVISVGSEATEVKEGDHVIYSPLLFDEIEHEEVKYHVVEEQDIFAVI